MLCGLQGSGKTTTCGKLARTVAGEQGQAHAGGGRLAATGGHRPVARDRRAAGCARLFRAGRPGSGQGLPATRSPRPARRMIAVVILDTAGRLAIDQELMEQLPRIDKQVQPGSGLSGRRRHDRSGRGQQRQGVQRGVGAGRRDHDQAGRRRPRRCAVVGQARHGRADQVHRHRRASGRAWSRFDPDGMASRILGMGDVRQLVREAQRLVDEKEREELERKMAEGRVHAGRLPRPADEDRASPA